MTRIAVIEKPKCNPVKCGNFLCIRVCPVNRTGQECIVKGEDGKAAINTELCTGCGICPKRCPFGAIHIVNLPEELDKNPIHRYGENGFHLYNLPAPLFGNVVGIIGRNGIGKTTAMRILAGVLKPNLGEDKEAGYDDLIGYFKGTESQIFFEKLRDREIKISYKPQQVELIPKQFSGKVIDLLKKADEKGRLEEISEKLGIKDILEYDIRNISGGELQKVAIAAAVLKKANVYFFDEPTSFLDIKQRIVVSRFIRALADENTAVVVIEHDLIILDYMTDFVHIMYGEQAAYGIVSQVKSTKAGINAYLDGYLREENIRFRDTQINFLARPPTESNALVALTSWGGIRKKLDSFELSAEKGELMKNEVVGVLGENGIGKTTFVKILAGVLKQDEGKISEKVRVSYKPQYLEAGNQPVALILKDAVKNNQLMAGLNLKSILDKNTGELSGGELQKVAVAECLSKDADLYLLDEPSAYLDVEQRLVVSKTIRDMIQQKNASCLVVDHDLLFADYLSDRIAVFSGKPAKQGILNGPFDMENGMNLFLKGISMTFRRDPESNRPRANKPNSQKDREQKSQGKLYYV